MKPDFDLFRASLSSTKSATIIGALGSILMALPADSAQTSKLQPAFKSMSAGAARSSATTELAQPADKFIDMLGIDVHLHYTDSPYGKAYSGIKSLLLGLGVRHIRDGVNDTSWQPYYDRLNDLGNAGIKSTLTTDRSQSSSLLLAYPRRVASSIEAYEAPNEQDIIYGNDSQWPQKARAFQKMLFNTVHGNSATQNLRVLGPSIGGAANNLQVGDISAYMDSGNFHDYFSGFNPGTLGWGSHSVFGWYGSIDTNMNIARVMAGSRPLEVTETGYNTGINVRGNVPLDVQGKYSPRILLEMFKRGVTRAFIYELIDNTTTPSTVNNFRLGLATAQLQPKPSYRAIANLNALLNDRSASFETTALTYSLSGDVSNVHHLLLQKHDGSYYLALWIEQPGWSPRNSSSGGGSYVQVSPQNVVLTLPRRARGFQLTAWQRDGSTTTTSASSSTVAAVSVSDNISVLHIVP